MKMYTCAAGSSRAVWALTTGQWCHGGSCSHNTRVQTQHIQANPKIYIFMRASAHTATEMCKRVHKFPKWIQKKDTEVGAKRTSNSWLLILKSEFIQKDITLFSKSVQIRRKHLDVGNQKTEGRGAQGWLLAHGRQLSHQSAWWIFGELTCVPPLTKATLPQTPTGSNQCCSCSIMSLLSKGQIFCPPWP